MTNRDKFDRYAAEAASDWEEEILHGEQFAAAGLPATMTISADSRVVLVPGLKGQAVWRVTPQGAVSASTAAAASAAAKEGRLPLRAVMDEKLIPQNLSEYEKILLSVPQGIVKEAVTVKVDAWRKAQMGEGTRFSPVTTPAALGLALDGKVGEDPMVDRGWMGFRSAYFAGVKSPEERIMEVVRARMKYLIGL